MSQFQVKCYLFPENVKVSEEKLFKANVIRRFNLAHDTQNGLYASLIDNIQITYGSLLPNKDEISTYWLDDEKDLVGFSTDAEMQNAKEILKSMGSSNPDDSVKESSLFKVYISKKMAVELKEPKEQKSLLNSSEKPEEKQVDPVLIMDDHEKKCPNRRHRRWHRDVSPKNEDPAEIKECGKENKHHRKWCREVSPHAIDDLDTHECCKEKAHGCHGRLHRNALMAHKWERDMSHNHAILDGFDMKKKTHGCHRKWHRNVSPHNNAEMKTCLFNNIQKCEFRKGCQRAQYRRWHHHACQFNHEKNPTCENVNSDLTEVIDSKASEVITENDRSQIANGINNLSINSIDGSNDKKDVNNEK